MKKTTRLKVYDVTVGYWEGPCGDEPRRIADIVVLARTTREVLRKVKLEKNEYIEECRFIRKIEIE